MNVFFTVCIFHEWDEEYIHGDEGRGDEGDEEPQHRDDGGAGGAVVGSVRSVPEEDIVCLSTTYCVMCLLPFFVVCCTYQMT